MHCPVCGARLEEALSYCQHCGADLRAVKGFNQNKPAEASIDTIIYLIVGTTITILGMCLGSLVLMQDKRIDFALGTIFVLLSFVAVVFVTGLLVWRLVRLTKGAKRSHEHLQPVDLNSLGPEAERTNPLLESGDAVPSITEQTTRTLEPSARGSKQP
jgi:hypothetical protein